MPAQRKHQLVNCQYFVWKIFRRQNGVWYADGRTNNQALGKHSLGTRDKTEAQTMLRRLDHCKAVERGLIHASTDSEKQPLPLEEGWEMYLDFCARPEVLGGVSQKTIAAYKRSRQSHLDFCRNRGIRYWNNFLKPEFDAYGAKLNRSYAPRTLYFRLTTTKSTLNWLIDEKHLPECCRFRLRLSKPQGSDTYCYSPEEVAAMLCLCNTDNDLKWLGNILFVLATTGLRIGELVSLRWSDVNLESSTIHLTDERSSRRRTQQGTARRTKGRRDRAIPIHPELQALLATLPRTAHGRVLCGPDNQPVKESSARYRFKTKVIAPLTKRFPTADGEIGFESGKFHSFRHYFISQAFIGGATEGEIMDWVGHKDSKTVELYRHLRNEDSQRRMQQINFIVHESDSDGPEPNAQ